MATSLSLSTDGVTLTLHAEPDRKALVVLSGAGMLSEALVEAEAMGIGAIFLKELLKSPRGWTDSKSWRSLEGQLSYVATCDPTGHVTIAVTLGSDWDSRYWSSTIYLHYELGQLEELSRRFTSFESALMTAA